VFDGSLTLVWADTTNGSFTPSPTQIIDRITSSFNPVQLAGIKKVADQAEILKACPQNFNLYSQCFAAVAFNPSPSPNTLPFNYTIYADGGLNSIDVEKHTSDFEKRVMPLQWAIDSVGVFDFLEFVFLIVVIPGRDRAPNWA
jgi:hypothetical protein